MLIRMLGVRRAFPLGGRTVEALRGVTLDVDAGEYVAVVGPSGCGKSTMLNVLGAVDRPTSGTVTVDGRDLGALRDRDATEFRLRRVGFVFQRFYLMPTLTARENVELPMAEARVARTERRARALELLAYVGLGERADHRPAQLSGGEQQRVAIARALANRPALVLADEPTGELDARTGTEIIDLFHRLNDDGTTLVVVTHDEKLADAARRVVHMRDGVVVDDTRESGVGTRDSGLGTRGGAVPESQVPSPESR
ncbi:ABC transporter related protein [Gemmatirosa kalamazoonensis]|uniref:ABC transporter related protein n=1 Tax=Gemmatirosa kalamazoonensis TaxID=861299 RepID=W0RQR0_9BACT|nr:ABC transporter ATP-binding protein [Gemmatirosa kalamazoonensis]AHG91893.1 ABC transporter related protein [Gemmatirosa kalamazoonensis]